MFVDWKSGKSTGRCFRRAWRGIALAIDVEPVADEESLTRILPPGGETPPMMSLAEG